MSPIQLLSALPRPIRVVTICLGLFIFVNFFFTLLSGGLPGQPEIHGGRYYFDSARTARSRTRSGSEASSADLALSICVFIGFLCPSERVLKRSATSSASGSGWTFAS